MERSNVFTMTKEQLKYEIFVLGLSIKQISEKYKRRRSVLDHLVTSYNIELPKSSLATLLTADLLEQDLLSGLTIREIAVKYSCSNATVSRYVKSFNLSYITNMGSPQIRTLYLQKAQLSDRQRSIIIGSLLGDGYISRAKSKVVEQVIGNASIEFCQTASRKDYLLWKAEELKPFIRRISQDKKYLTYYASTVNYYLFNEFYNIFIKEGKKVVPTNISTYLNDLVLSVWVQDDGRTESYWSNLCTQGFTEDDNYILAKALEDKFDLKARVKIWKGSKGNLYYLRFDSSEHKKLHSIVDHLFHSCFEYKKFKK